MTRPSLPLELARLSAAYAVGALAGWSGFRLLLGQTIAPTDPCLLAGLAALLLAAAADRRVPIRRLWTIGWTLFGALALVNVFAVAVSVHQYGDAAYLTKYLVDGRPGVTRWFGGYAALLAGFRALGILGSSLDPHELAALYVRVTGVVAVVGGSLLLTRRFPERFSAILPVTTPIWLLFAVGYIEYYPFLAAVLVGFLHWVAGKPLAERSPVAVGLFSALLFPILYVGFLPFAALLLAAYAIARPRRLWIALAVGALMAVLAVVLLWPGPTSTFFALDDIPRGDTASASVYRGHAASDSSILFAPDYVFTREHLSHLAMMWLSGAGALCLPLAVALGALAWRRSGLHGLRRVAAEPRALFFLALTAALTGFFFLMIPKLGPVKDLDLFWSVYLSAAFLVGLALDRLSSTSSLATPTVKRLLLAAWIGAAIYSTAVLVVHGLPGSTGWYSQGRWH